MGMIILKKFSDSALWSGSLRRERVTNAVIRRPVGRPVEVVGRIKTGITDIMTESHSGKLLHAEYHCVIMDIVK